MRGERNRIRVYVATSLDGFIAGPDGGLSWLPDVDAGAPGNPGSLGYDEFMAGVGAILMGRREPATRSSEGWGAGTRWRSCPTPPSRVEWFG